MRKILSGIIGLFLGLIFGINALMKIGANQNIDPVAIMFSAVFLFLGIYYLIVGSREKEDRRKEKIEREISPSDRVK